MREKLNSNPMAQAGVVVVLIVAVAFLFITRMGGEESEEAPSTEATVGIAGTEVTGTATGGTPGEAVEGAVENALGAAEASASAVVPAVALEAPPLPAPVQAAYDADKTVALLFVHDEGIDDHLVKRAVPQLEGVPNTAVFVVPVAQIADYAAATLATEVQRVPALVVMRPRSLSGGVPQATVSYGFQDPQTLVQQVRDASYNGPTTTYHPN